MYFFLICGYGAGKTSANSDGVFRAISYVSGHRDREGHNPRIGIYGLTLKHLNFTLLGYIRGTLRNSSTPYVEDKKNNIIYVGDVEIYVHPMENPEDIAGFDEAVCVVEEIDELPEEKMVLAVQAITERCRQQLIGLRPPWIQFGSTAQGQRGLYRTLQHFRASGVPYVMIRGRTQDNIYLPSSYIENMMRIYSPEERAVYMDAQMLALAQGRVIGDFDWARNYLNYDLDQDVGEGETVFIAQDINEGYHRGLAGIIRGGVIYIIKDYDFPELRDAPSVFRHDFPRNKVVWIPDATAKEQYGHFARELRKYNIHLIYRPKNPSVESTVFLLNKLLYTGRMLVCKIAKDTASSFSSAMRDKKTNLVPKGVGPKSPIHRIDSARYMAHYIVSNKREFRDIRRLTIARKEMMESDEDDIVEQQNGYVDISPAAFYG